MGLDELHLYDLYVPLAQGVECEVPLRRGRARLQEALAPLGAGYGVVLGRHRPGQRLDRRLPPRQQESGAFSASVYGDHPT